MDEPSLPRVSRSVCESKASTRKALAVGEAGAVQEEGTVGGRTVVYAEGWRTQ